MRKIKIDGVIFDMDGTLLNSMFIWENASERYLLNLGIQPGDGLNEEFKKLTLEQGAEYFISHYGVRQPVEEIVRSINNSVEERYKTEAYLKDGVADFLEQIQSSGRPMCVATATDRCIVEPVLERLGIMKYFSKIFTCSEVGANKRRPDIFIKAAEYLGTAPENTAVFEDSYFAIRSAKSAGFFVVGVQDDYEAHNKAKIRELSDVFLERYTDKAYELTFFCNKK